MPSRKPLARGLYEAAREQCAALGSDTELAMERAAEVPLSLHCWQGDDVGGFDQPAGELGGGLAVTGCHPGKARTPDELRADLDQALALLPGTHRINLHACYAEAGDGPRIDRDALTPRHFRRWLDWGGARGLHFDFNPTFFGHPKATGGLPLTDPDPAIRDFWVEHGKRCREIAAAMGREQGSSVLNNFWTPDGSKDSPADRLAPRRRLAESLDRIFRRKSDPALTVESVESKLFGMGCESYTAGSHEFYLGYAITRRKFLCLDAGHFHPTEVISDKLSALYDFVPGLALHLSRPVRWDSDHVVAFSDELVAIAQELVAHDLFPRTRIGLDYFDASINRVAAWVIGARNARKALLLAFLTPHARLREAEADGDLTARLALQEEFRQLPLGAVWDRFCQQAGVPVGLAWLDAVRDYERTVLQNRGIGH